MEAVKSSVKKTVDLLECSQQEDNELDQIYADMGEYNDGDQFPPAQNFIVCLAQSVFATSECVQEHESVSPGFVLSQCLHVFEYEH